MSKLIKKHFVKDYRRELSASILNSKYNWPHFFGICLAVKKDAFEKSGRFDDSLSGWGIEDIDFTYRLSRIGILKFITTAQLFHLPHPRNRYENYMHDAYNHMECMKKYDGDLEWELNYRFSKLADILAIIDAITYYHKNVLYQIPITKSKSTIYIDAITGKCPRGNIIAFNENGKRFQYHGMGTTLPFPNKKFEYGYISYYSMNYPAPIVSILLQEICRVSKKVIMPKIRLDPVIKWGKTEERKCRHRTKRFETFPVKISDFIIRDHGNHYEVTTSLPDSPYSDDWEAFYELI